MAIELVDIRAIVEIEIARLVARLPKLGIPTLGMMSA